MAYTAKDGSRHTNKDSAQRADARYRGSVAEKEPDPEDPVEFEEDEQEDPHGVVEEHGPAEEVRLRHGGEGHSVDSVHGDGYEHHSEHGSAGEAHDHAKCLSGDCGCGGM